MNAAVLEGWILILSVLAVLVLTGVLVDGILAVAVRVWDRERLTDDAARVAPIDVTAVRTEDVEAVDARVIRELRP